MLLAAVTHVVVDKLPSSGNEWLTYVPTVAAAIGLAAAVASWRAVIQARQIWQQSLLPVLMPLLEAEGSQLRLRVMNVSKMPAVDAGWAALWDPWRNEGHLPQRSLKVDADAALIDDVMPADIGDIDAEPPPVAIVWCRDLRGDLHVWTTAQQHTVLKRRTIEGWDAVRLLETILEVKLGPKVKYCGRPGQQVGTL